MTSRQEGFSLIELMIALVVTFVLVFALLEFYINHQSANQTLVKTTKLHNMLNSTASTLVSEIRRAGYRNSQGSELLRAETDQGYIQVNDNTVIIGPSSQFQFSSTDIPLIMVVDSPDYGYGALLITDINANSSGAQPIPIDTVLTPFTNLPVDKKIQGARWKFYKGSLRFGLESISVPNSTCVLFAYDLNDDGIFNASNSASHTNERMGFRYNSTDKTIEMRTGGSTYDCTSTTNNFWQAITNPNDILITSASFVLNTQTIYVSGSAGENVRRQTLTLSLTAELPSNSNITASITQQVPVMNDQYRFS